MKKVKKFGDKKLNIRFPEKSDVKNAVRFQKYINELAEDDMAFILRKKKVTLKEERKWIKEKLENIKKGKSVTLTVENNKKIVATVSITLNSHVRNHIGTLGISILKDYRGIGLGKYLMKEILKLAKKKLKPKTVRLSVVSKNKIAFSLYKKMGFKKVAVVPKQFNYKGKLHDEFIMLKDL